VAHSGLLLISSRGQQIQRAESDCVEIQNSPRVIWHAVWHIHSSDTVAANEVRYPDDDLNRNLGAGTGDSEVGCFIDAVSE